MRAAAAGSVLRNSLRQPHSSKYRIYEGEVYRSAERRRSGRSSSEGEDFRVFCRTCRPTPRAPHREFGNLVILRATLRTRGGGREELVYSEEKENEDDDDDF